LPSFIRQRGLLERVTLYDFYEDGDWSGWSDLARAPVQDILDKIPLVRDAAVHVSGASLIRSEQITLSDKT
jgi:hypothetical protein